MPTTKDIELARKCKCRRDSDGHEEGAGAERRRVNFTGTTGLREEEPFTERGVYEFSVTAVTKDHKLGGLNRNSLPQCWSAAI